jgi:tRNA (uracil-5-)-methyltransferase
MPTGAAKQPCTVGVPFQLVQAVPVDMFPHTPHGELVVLFERIPVDVVAAASGSTQEPSSVEGAAPAAHTEG